MDINKVYLTGTVSAVSYKTQRNSFKLKFSLKTEGQNSESPDSCKKSKKDGASRDLALYSIKRMRLSLRDFIKLSDVETEFLYWGNYAILGLLIL